MGDPVLHVLAGPNGAGKTTLWRYVLEPVLRLDFVDADLIAADRWRDDPVEHAYEAAAAADDTRQDLIAARRSFATETVFSHPSKVDLVDEATEAGYLVTMHVLAVPVGLAVARVRSRVENGGHAVPDDKVRERYRRLWRLLGAALPSVDHAHVYDNTTASDPFRPIAEFEPGELLWAEWPSWAPRDLRRTGSA